MIKNLIRDKINALGFVNTQDRDTFFSYEKYNTKYSCTQVVCLHTFDNKRYDILSYRKDTDNDGVNIELPLTLYERLLFNLLATIK